MKEQSNKLDAFTAFGIGYSEQLNTTGGRCVVTCVGYGYFTDGTTEYDLLYDDGNGKISTACAPDTGRVPYQYGQVVAVYP
jgi:hypothetical protein